MVGRTGDDADADAATAAPAPVAAAAWDRWARSHERSQTPTGRVIAAAAVAVAGWSSPAVTAVVGTAAAPTAAAAAAAAAAAVPLVSGHAEPASSNSAPSRSAATLPARATVRASCRPSLPRVNLCSSVAAMTSSRTRCARCSCRSNSRCAVSWWRHAGAPRRVSRLSSDDERSWPGGCVSVGGSRFGISSPCITILPLRSVLRVTTRIIR